ncbi:MAG: NAD-dependent epimerase/dehydratase family protein [Phycisphaerales bacterium]|nr:NAD-dependent epimerase/dehydratase family protein [Phycisphaerales bacterium]
MNILILGGTQFSGRAFVEQAVNANHSVTLLHRSKADPGLPPAIRRLVGDRDPKVGDGLDRIKELLDAGEHFDAVVDMCGYTPRVTKAACDLLKDHTDLYIFISTISVYDKAEPDAILTEDSPKITLDDPTVEEVTGETYGGLKVLCEQVVIDAFPDSHCIPRPCVIAGPNDPTDRVTWWARMLTTQDALVISSPLAGLASFIDARDLAAFFLHCATNKTTGIFNATGPEPTLSLHDFIHRTHKALDSKTKLIEVSQARLEELNIQAWQDIPTWLPEEKQYMHAISSIKARAVGLINRPLEETMIAIRDWDIERGSPDLSAGMAPDRITQLVSKI